MDEMNKKRSRGKKSTNQLVAVLTVLSISLAAALAVTLVMYYQKQKEAFGLLTQNKQLMQEMEKAIAEAEAASQPQGEEESQKQDIEEKKQESGKTETGTEIGTETKTEETAEETTKAPYLQSLSGLSPGTVLSRDQLDFSDIDRYFMSWEIEEGDNLYERINGKSYQKNDYVPLSSIRYLKMPHFNFDGNIQVGELIVSKEIEEDVIQVFKELFEAEYQIQSMYLIDNYWTGDPDTTDSASIDQNNTSAFCFRQVTGGQKLSNHAYGKAIDLNPQQNPYVSYSSGSPKWSHENANDYIERDTGLAHVITHEDLAYKVFKKYGFQWGGDWNNPKDYQHFDKN